MKDKKKSQKRRILYRTSGLGRSGGESEVGRRKSVSRAQSQALELQVRIIMGISLEKIVSSVPFCMYARRSSSYKIFFSRRESVKRVTQEAGLSEQGRQAVEHRSHAVAARTVYTGGGKSFEVSFIYSLKHEENGEIKLIRTEHSDNRRSAKNLSRYCLVRYH